MLIFPIYALLVWYVCFRWRRSWIAFLAALAGAFAVVTLALMDARLRVWFNLPRTAFSNLQILLWIEAIAVGVVGLFIACLPRGYSRRPCRRCGYDLSGLEDANPTCPECGLACAVAKPDESPSSQGATPQGDLREADKPVDSAARASASK